MKAVILILSFVSGSLLPGKDPEKKPANLPPSANAGADIRIGSNEFAQLDGTASREPDGIISRYQWVQVSGKPVTIVNPQAAITAVSGVSKGEYVFRLAVTDEKGSSSSDEVKLVITE